MIHFKSVFYKNFLSTGNAGTTIQLDKFPTMLIQGNSGSGKSTMIDALCFGLYGKAFRHINKPQVINSVNGKHCVVEVEFTIGDAHYKVVRGMKPARFEIYLNHNPKPLNQDANLKDYQKVLEQQILGMSFKTFTQISILGSTAYTPFMELSPAARREVIEDILDIGIFSTMNQLLKAQTQETKDQQVLTDADLRAKKEKAEGLQKLISVLSNKQNNEIDEIRQNLVKIDNEISILDNEYSEIEKINDDLANRSKNINELIEQSNQLLCSITEVGYQCTSAESDIKFFEDNDTCPKCSQSIKESYKKTMVKTLSESAAELAEKKEQLEKERKDVRDTLDATKALVREFTDNTQRLSSIGTALELLRQQQVDGLSKLQEKTEVSTDIAEAKDDLKAAAREVLNLIDKKKQLATQREIQENAAMLLRDSGIKTAIIREYLPLINKLLNKYLTDMELFVEFHLDEAFNEVIKSRHRDEFTYGNFSEGEKMRISMALMFTWRHIAKLKNSASCNLLILDEILVGRLDQANSDIVIGLINNIAAEGTHVFAISHGDALQDKFNGLMTFQKQGDFSVAT